MGDPHEPHTDLTHHTDVPKHVDLTHHTDVPRHVDLTHHTDAPKHVDLVPHHVDSGRHIDLRHVDVPPGHIDTIPHVDGPRHHVDVRHIDVTHHTDVQHVDLGPPHSDSTPPHADAGFNHWWQNWPKTHGYIAMKMLFPTSVDEIAAGVQEAEAASVPIRAVGGGWSFSDAPLPGNVTTGRPTPTQADGIAKFVPLAEGFPPDDQPSIASIDPGNSSLMSYDINDVRTVGNVAGQFLNLQQFINPALPQPVFLINTRSLKSTLQVNLASILSRAAVTATAAGPAQKHYFHVEAGITMEEIGPLLDAQSPRLQLGASGGNPGATLAGSIATATHGAEFSAALLIDRVRAVHLVGPGGQQWWIEGAESIANPTKLIQKFPGLDAAHIISGTSPVQGILPQDWLNAVVVSMGCMGVLYSVVIEVFPLGGSQQVTTQMTWLGLLGKVSSQDSTLLGFTGQRVVSVLRNTADPAFPAVSAAIQKLLEGGTLTNGVIAPGSNTYADLAFNPNVAPGGSNTIGAGDNDCWVVNRQTVPVPFDSQPPSSPGVTEVLTSVVNQVEAAFAANANTANMDSLVIRLLEVYGISKPFHVDIPFPHIDLPPPHGDISEHIDVSEHIDIPGSMFHVDADPHADISAFHIDASFFGQHADISPHVDFGQHIDISPHVDVPGSALHIDVNPHIDVTEHVDLGHVDLNSFIQGIVQGTVGDVASLVAPINGFGPLLEQLVLGGLDLTQLGQIIKTVVNSTDTLDIALDQLTTPLLNAGAMDLAQPFLTGLLASVLGTANPAKVGISIGTGVGAIGFPDSGLVGAGLEIALPVETAFGFLQTQVLDKMQPNMPFFGYVSVRLCPQTSTLMGMQQWPTSVMIEVVAFGDPWGIQYCSQLQAAALAYIAQGNDAMLHWGLENDQMTSMHLARIPALQQASVSQSGRQPLTKLAAFKLVRSMLAANQGLNPTSLFPAFDNGFTARLNLG
jgi:hypothetical protein